jgi:hypothetical protein
MSRQFRRGAKPSTAAAPMAVVGPEVSAVPTIVGDVVRSASGDQ